jgi:HEAT repeat protein
MIIMSVVTNIADYQLDLSLQRFFSGNGNGMLSFLGLFQLITGVLALSVQLFATNRLMERFGLVTSLLILPASIALGSGFILLTGGILLAAAWPRGSDIVFRYTVNDAALNTLFLPIQPDLRRRAKAILDGIIKPPVIGLLGLVFLFFQQDAAAGAQAGTIMAWSVPVIVLTAVWLILVQRVRGQYRAALADSLRQRRLDLSAAEIDVSDETTIQVLAQSLQDPDELQVIHALNLMTHAPEVDWHPYIIPLLEHPSIQVRLMVLNMMQTSGQAEYAEQIVPQFRAEEGQVRAAAIEAYCALQEEGAIEKVVGFLEEENLQIRSAAIVGLTRYGGLDGILQAASYLKAMLTDDTAEIRARGAQILGKLGVQNFYRPLIPLLDDPIMRVQISAIRAAGQLRHRALVPHLINKLGQAVTALAATDALVAYGAGIEPALAEAMACEENTAVRLQIPKILQQIPTPESIQILLNYIDDSYDHLRGRILKALTRCQNYDITLSIGKEYLQKVILYEIRRYYLLFVILDDLGALGRGVLLDDALQTHLQYSSERLFHLFALLYPRQNVLQIQQGLVMGDARLRANAIELLDNIAERNIKELAIPLIEADKATILSIAHSQLNIPSRSLTERLEQLAAHPSPWLRACVLYQIGTLHMTELAHLVTDCLQEDEEVVRETGVCASKHLLPRHEFRTLCQEKTADSSPKIQQYSQQLLTKLNPSPVT